MHESRLPIMELISLLMILVRIILLAEMCIWSCKVYLRLKKKIST